MRTTENLVEHRLLPRAERELFQYEIVRFHLEDLNALAERRRARRGQRAAAPHERDRAAAIIQAARWDRAGFLTAIRRFIKEGRADGMDAFGPTLLLLALGSGREAFLPSVPPSVRKLAESVLEETGRGSPRSPTRRRAPPPTQPRQRR